MDNNNVFRPRNYSDMVEKVKCSRFKRNSCEKDLLKDENLIKKSILKYISVNDSLEKRKEIKQKFIEKMNGIIEGTVPMNLLEKHISQETVNGKTVRVFSMNAGFFDLNEFPKDAIKEALEEAELDRYVIEESESAGLATVHIELKQEM